MCVCVCWVFSGNWRWFKTPSAGNLYCVSVGGCVRVSHTHTDTLLKMWWHQICANEASFDLLSILSHGSMRPVGVVIFLFCKQTDSCFLTSYRTPWQCHSNHPKNHSNKETNSSRVFTKWRVCVSDLMI